MQRTIEEGVFTSRVSPGVSIVSMTGPCIDQDLHMVHLRALGSAGSWSGAEAHPDDALLTVHNTAGVMTDSARVSYVGNGGFVIKWMMKSPSPFAITYTVWGDEQP